MLLLLGCPRHSLNLTQDAATRRAMTAAVKEGRELRDYKLPVVQPPDGPNGHWALQFDPLEGRPGPPFVVSVDDRTGDAQVMPGK